MMLIIALLSLLSFLKLALCANGVIEGASDNASAAATTSSEAGVVDKSQFLSALAGIQDKLSEPAQTIEIPFSTKRILQILHSEPTRYEVFVDILAAAFNRMSRESRETGGLFWDALTQVLSIELEEEHRGIFFELLNRVAESPNQPLAIYGPLAPFNDNTSNDYDDSPNEYISYLFGKRYRQLINAELNNIKILGVQPQSQGWVDFLVLLYHIPLSGIYTGPDGDLQMAYLIEAFIQNPEKTFNLLVFFLQEVAQCERPELDEVRRVDTLQQLLLQETLRESPEQAHQPLRNLTNFPAGFDMSSSTLSIKVELRPVEPKSFAMFRSLSLYACNHIDGFSPFEKELICKVFTAPSTRDELRFFMTAFASTYLCFPNFIESSPQFWHSLIYHTVKVMANAASTAFISISSYDSFSALGEVTTAMLNFYKRFANPGYLHFLRHSILYGHEETVMDLFFDDTLRHPEVTSEILFEHLSYIIKTGNSRLAERIFLQLNAKFRDIDREIMYVAAASSGLFNLIPQITIDPRGMPVPMPRSRKIEAIIHAVLHSHLKTLTFLLKDLADIEGNASKINSPELEIFSGKLDFSDFKHFALLEEAEFPMIITALLKKPKPLSSPSKSTQNAPRTVEVVNSTPTAAAIEIVQEETVGNIGTDGEKREGGENFRKSLEVDYELFVIQSILFNYITESPDSLIRGLKAIKLCSILGRLDLVEFIVSSSLTGCRIPFQDQIVQDTIFVSVLKRSIALQTTKPFVKLDKQFKGHCQPSQEARDRALLHTISQGDYKILKYLVEASGLTFSKSTRQKALLAAVQTKTDLVPIYLLKNPKFRPHNSTLHSILTQLLKTSNYHVFKEFCRHWVIEEDPLLVRELLLEAIEFTSFKPFEFLNKTYGHLFDSALHNRALFLALNRRKFFVIEFYLEAKDLHPEIDPKIFNSAKQLMFSKWNLDDQILEDLVADMLDDDNPMILGNKDEFWDAAFAEVDDNTEDSSSRGSSSDDEAPVHGINNNNNNTDSSSSDDDDSFEDGDEDDDDDTLSSEESSNMDMEDAIVNNGENNDIDG